MGQPGPVHN